MSDCIGFPKFRELALASAAALLLSCSSQQPEKIDRILLLDPARPATLAHIVSEYAAKTGMSMKRQDFQFGGDDGVQRSILAHGAGIEVLITAISIEECQSFEGYRRPRFSRSTFAVSIYRTSIFPSSTSLSASEEALSREARKRGARLVSEAEKCLNEVGSGDGAGR